MKKAALFDLDGVVFDTEPLYSQFWGSVFKRYYPDQPGLEQKIKGSTLVQIYDRYFAGRQSDQDNITKDLNEFEHNMPFRYIPGFESFIVALRERGVKTAVVSNKPDATTKALAEKFFPGMPALGQRDGVDPKPSPALVAQALSDLGVRPENAVYVGDSEGDVATARNAGLPLIAVSWGFRGREKLEIAGAEHIADTAPQLLEMLCR